MADTTADTAVPEGQGKTDAVVEGAATGTATNAGKLFTQDQLDSIVKSRIAEERKRLDAKFGERLAAELETAKGDFEKSLDKMVETRIAEREAKAQVDAKRAALMEQYGLTESQAARLNGNTPEELEADAKELFGKFVPQKDEAAEMRKAVQERLGLTDKQMARLQGDNEEQLLADAKEVFNVEPKAAGQGTTEESKTQPKPPVLKTGETAGQVPGPTDLTTLSPAEVRKNWRKALGQD